MMAVDENLDGYINGWDAISNSHWESVYGMCDEN